MGQASALSGEKRKRGRPPKDGGSLHRKNVELLKRRAAPRWFSGLAAALENRLSKKPKLFCARVAKSELEIARHALPYLLSSSIIESIEDRHYLPRLDDAYLVCAAVLLRGNHADILNKYLPRGDDVELLPTVVGLSARMFSRLVWARAAELAREALRLHGTGGKKEAHANQSYDRTVDSTLARRPDRYKLIDTINRVLDALGLKSIRVPAEKPHKSDAKGVYNEEVAAFEKMLWAGKAFFARPGQNLWGCWVQNDALVAGSGLSIRRKCDRRVDDNESPYRPSPRGPDEKLSDYLYRNCSVHLPSPAPISATRSPYRRSGSLKQQADVRLEKRGRDATVLNYSANSIATRNHNRAVWRVRTAHLRPPSDS